MIGKQKCRILKEIRQKIADENDIPYVTRECSYQGECSGTCPRCESELRYLEQSLALRASMGKRVAVTALCAAVSLSAAACSPSGVGNGGIPDDICGMITYEDPLDAPEKELGAAKSKQSGFSEPVPDDPETVEIQLMGDVAWFPEMNQDG